MDWIRGRYDEHLQQQAQVAQRSRSGRMSAAVQFREHFGPRGRGILPSSVRGGSYFTGRVRVLAKRRDGLEIKAVLAAGREW